LQAKELEAAGIETIVGNIHDETVLGMLFPMQTLLFIMQILQMMPMLQTVL
jgi:hypothetical protein